MLYKLKVFVSKVKEKRKMYVKPHSFVNDEAAAGDVNNYVNDQLIEKIWCELGKQNSYEQIHQAALEVAAEFRDAAITTFIPIFIHRRTLEKLRG
ncbi:MAG TPA: hypothetical protein P5526_11105 [Anaerolineae bacterium]|nr:hypothetical protein [Anaerolineae bacterium]